MPRYPALEGFGHELRQLLVAMDADGLLQDQPLQRIPVGPVRQPRRLAGQASEQIRIAQHPLAQADAVLLRVNRLGALNQLREIELKFVVVARRVGTAQITQAAFVAQVHHPLALLRAQLAYVIALGIDRVEQRGKRGTQIKAQPASVADVVDSKLFALEAGAVPVFRLVGIVGKRIGGSRLDTAAHIFPLPELEVGMRAVIEHNQDTTPGEALSAASLRVRKSGSRQSSRPAAQVLRLAGFLCLRRGFYSVLCALEKRPA